MSLSSPSMTNGTVVVRRTRPNVAHVILHRPEQHNAMSIELIRDLRALLSELGADPTVQAVVLAAEGPTFSAGGDLRWMERMLASSREERLAESQELAEMLHELARFPRPVVARVHGPAFGGGLGLIACCDIVIAVRSARFALTEVGLGLVPANVGPYVIRRMGDANARRAMLTGAGFNADDAVRWGLVTMVVDPTELDSTLNRELNALLAQPAEAVTSTKAFLRYVLEHPEQEPRSYSARWLADAWDTAAAQRGIARFLATRHGQRGDMASGSVS